MPDDLQSLRAALEAANRQTAAANARAGEAEGAARHERVARVSAQEGALDTEIARMQGEDERLTQQIAEKNQEGDYVAAATLSRQQAHIAANLARRQDEKTYLANQRQLAEREPADPLARFTPQEREWISRNPAYLNDPAFQAKVNAAAQAAEHLNGIPRNTEKWFEHIERAVYPDRFQQQNQQDRDAAPVTDHGATDDDDIGMPDGPVISVALEQQHTRDVPIPAPTPEAPSMRIDQRPEDPQARAVGRGGGGISAVAAPPSRRISQAVGRVTPGQTRIEPTAREYEVAMSLAESIEPDIARRGPEEVIRWYHTMYNHPSHRSARRRSWVYPEGNAA